MRVLLVNYEYPPLGGGGGIAMMEFAQELAKAHEVHVLTSGIKGLNDIENHEKLDLTIHRAPVVGRSDRATASFASMASFLSSGTRVGNRLLKETNFDVINTWFAIPSGIVGARISRKNKVPHVLTIIGGDIYDPSKWYSPHRFLPAKWAVKGVLRRSHRFLAISSDIVNRARHYFRFDEPVKVIPLGITEPQFKPASREDLGMSPDRKYIVAVGRLVRRKDYPMLLNSLKQLDRDDVDFIILGDGPEKDNLAALAQTLGIAHRVHLKGFVSNELKYQYLANSDIFALVSLHEGFGLVYLEAMYCGLPIIAADEGGQIDILSAPESGGLVPVGDVEKTVHCLIDLFDNDEERREIGQRNRLRFEQYSISSLTEQYEAVFRDVVRRHGAGSAAAESGIGS